MLLLLFTPVLVLLLAVASAGLAGRPVVGWHWSTGDVEVNTVERTLSGSFTLPMPADLTDPARPSAAEGDVRLGDWSVPALPGWHRTAADGQRPVRSFEYAAPSRQHPAGRWWTDTQQPAIREVAFTRRATPLPWWDDRTEAYVVFVAQDYLRPVSPAEAFARVEARLRIAGMLAPSGRAEGGAVPASLSRTRFGGLPALVVETIGPLPPLAGSGGRSVALIFADGHRVYTLARYVPADGARQEADEGRAAERAWETLRAGLRRLH